MTATKQRHPSILSVAAHHQKAYYQQEQLIQEMLALRSVHQTDYSRERKIQIANELGLSLRRLDAIVQGYDEYRALYGEDAAVDYLVPNIPRHPRVIDLDREAQQPFHAKEQFIQSLLLIRSQNNGELPKYKRKEAAVFLGCTPRNINYLIQNYIAYAELYGRENAVDYFRPLPRGKKSGTTLTSLQQAACRFALLKRVRSVKIDGDVYWKEVEY